MDIAATILAGLIVLSIPLLWWLGSKARARREQEIADIKTLVDERSRILEERSHGLTELYSRLDALDGQDSKWETKVGEDPVNQAQFATPSYHKAFSDRKVALEKHLDARNVALERYYLALNEREAVLERHLNTRNIALKYYLATLEPTTDLQSVSRLYRCWLEEAETDPEWLSVTNPHEPVRISGSRRKSGLRRGSQRTLRGPALQPSIIG